jgi:hypothetical protein
VSEGARPARAPEPSSVYAFADDFIDEGIASVADLLAAHGFGGASLATVYHAARDVVPHNPKRAVVHRDEGVHYFEPDVSRYRGPLRPQRGNTETAAFEQVTAALADRGLWWQAWTVYLHNCRLAIAHPSCAVTNAFGDVYITDLCPSNADVATYAVDLTTDVARLRPSLVVAESLHHAGFGHGYHHERSFVDVPAVTAFLLSLCFCAACIERADVDGQALAGSVRDIVRGSLAGTTPLPDRVDRAGLADVVGPELAGYLAARERTVAAVVAECAAAAHAEGVPFGFMDQTGALKGYVTGEPTGPVAAADAWQLGIDPAAVSAVSDTYIALTYAKDPDRVRLDAAAYASAIDPNAGLRCVLRHGKPDSTGIDDLRPKMSAIGAAGGATDFYHYGLMPLAGLAAASQAIAAASEAVGTARDGASTGS